MLPLEEIYFIPSLVIVPVAFALLLALRGRSANYAGIWRSAMIACVVLSGLFFAQVVQTPLYSERDKSPDNPGGFSTSITSAIGVFVAETCLLMPAFPLLLVLASLPPDGLPAHVKTLLLAASCLYVGVLGTLIVRKNADYQEDYKQSRRQELIQREKWKKQQRRP